MEPAKPMTHEKLVEYGRAVWTKRDKTKVRLSRMDVGHLRNCAAMLRRNAEKAEREATSAAGYGGSGDMAQMYADHAMNYAFERMSRFQAAADAFDRYAAAREAAGWIQHGPEL